jgi:hypothetical protein
MKHAKRSGAVLFTGAVILLGSALAKADAIGFALSTPTQAGVVGDLLAFDATVTNLTASYLYFNFDSSNLDGSVTSPSTPPGLYLDDTAFFLTFAYDASTGAYDLAPSGQAGDTYVGLLFTVTILPGTDPGLYSGDFEILGGADQDAQDVLGTQDFNVQVNPDVVTPEPPIWQLVSIGLAGFFAMTCRNFYRRQTAVQPAAQQFR